ncbi:MAG: tellurium resistance protein TerC, partial [Gluconacetobacter sp.]
LWVLISGLAISVLMMALAASLIARLLERFRWIAWIGLLIVLGVAIELIIKGGGEIWHVVS